jgi:hypothetical protein
MRSNASPRMSVVKKEDKETKIRDFIEQDLAARRCADGSTPTTASYLLMALSSESPVARALASLASELASAGIVVQAVFAKAGQPVMTEAATGFERVATLRHSPDARLLDAHEQLILGPSSVWVGDCMRRDPAKRDAYECYTTDSTETAIWANRSFDRVWARAKPMRAGASAPGMAHATIVMDAATAEALAAMGEAAPTAGATRH